MESTSLTQSYQSKIAELFQAGEKLTVLDTLQKVGTIELRHFVSELRKQGMDITSTWTKGSNGKRFKIYFLNQYGTN